MTNDRPPRSGSVSAVGMQKHKRSPTAVGLALLTPLVGQEFLDRYGLRDPLNRGLRYGVKTPFSALGASTRHFKRGQGIGRPPPPPPPHRARYLHPTPPAEAPGIVQA